MKIVVTGQGALGRTTVAGTGAGAGAGAGAVAGARRARLARHDPRARRVRPARLGDQVVAVGCDPITTGGLTLAMTPEAALAPVAAV